MISTRFVPLLLVLGLLTVLTGCRVSRHIGAPPVATPYDPTWTEYEKAFEKLKAEAVRVPERQAYTIGPGDVLAITLVGRPEIFGTDAAGQNVFRYTVTDDPMLSLPYVGTLRVHGRTQSQLQEDIRAAYSNLIKNPEPVVTIDRFYYNQISVLGSIRVPGRYPLNPGDTLLEAIFKANGLTMGGNTGGAPPARIVKIYRDRLNQRQRMTSTPEELLDLLNKQGNVDGREEIIVPLEKFILGGDLTYNVPLQANDIVYVPPAGSVSVMGLVRQPKAIYLGPSVRTLAHVLTDAGGLRFKADNHVEIVRTNPDGTQESHYIDARAVFRRDEPDFMMKENDQVFVYSNPWLSVWDFFGQVFKPVFSTGVNATYDPINKDSNNNN